MRQAVNNIEVETVLTNDESAIRGFTSESSDTKTGAITSGTYSGKLDKITRNFDGLIKKWNDVVKKPKSKKRGTPPKKEDKEKPNLAKGSDFP